MSAPLSVTVNCSTNCIEWCPRSGALHCCCLHGEASDADSISSSSVKSDTVSETEKVYTSEIKVPQTRNHHNHCCQIL